MSGNMNWLTIIWSMSAAVSLTLGAIHLLIWLEDRKGWASLFFSVTALAVTVFAAFELVMMRAETPEQFGMAMRWIHVPAWVIVSSLLGFVSLYLRAGRRWLAWVIVGV